MRKPNIVNVFREFLNKFGSLWVDWYADWYDNVDMQELFIFRIIFSFFFLQMLLFTFLFLLHLPYISDSNGNGLKIRHSLHAFFEFILFLLFAIFRKSLLIML